MPALILVASFLLGVLAHYGARKWRAAACDACRLDDMNKGDMPTWIPHTCSRRRGFYRDKSGDVIQFGRRRGEPVR